MTKENIIKALELCGHVNNPYTNEVCVCEKCPYIGMDNCDDQMCADAVAMLKANDEAPKAKYPVVYIFTKRDNMSKYLTTKVLMDKAPSRDTIQDLRNYYAKEREIQLLAKFRWEGSKCFCKIQCPINPLPVDGEFKVPGGTTTPVLNFLKEHGWKFQRKINVRLFM